MGHARWNDQDWNRYAAGLRGQSRDQIFGSRGLAPEFDPARIDVRESRDSEMNPKATPIIVAVDVTGSMGHLAELLVREGVAELMKDLLENGRVPDPHLMCMGIGDAWCDQAPLQATQFEADLRVVEQLGRIWIEGGGGGNGEESYILPWAFAATKTACDAIEKGRAKGILVTVGDDAPPLALLRDHARRIGVDMAHDLDAAELLAIVERDWEVFHLIIEEGYQMQGRGGDVVRRAWRDLLGERAIAVADHREMPRIIAGLAERCQGARPAAKGRAAGGMRPAGAGGMWGSVRRFGNALTGPRGASRLAGPRGHARMLPPPAYPYQR